MGQGHVSHQSGTSWFPVITASSSKVTVLITSLIKDVTHQYTHTPHNTLWRGCEIWFLFVVLFVLKITRQSCLHLNTFSQSLSSETLHHHQECWVNQKMYSKVRSGEQTWRASCGVSKGLRGERQDTTQVEASRTGITQGGAHCACTWR